MLCEKHTTARARRLVHPCDCDIETVSGLTRAQPLCGMPSQACSFGSHEWISNVEEVELSEICIGGVEGSDLVLSK
jgi:hypothetical protein